VIDGGWSDAYNHDNCTDCVDAHGRPQPNLAKVRKTPSRPRSWANFSLL
jgi:hypothetical protein